MITFVEAPAKARRTPGVIPLHGSEGFEGMRKAGALTAEALDILTEYVEAGVPTSTIDKVAYEFARDHGAVPATIFYKGYRHSLCTSINHVVCQPSTTSVRSILTISPSRKGRSSGMPWQTTWLIEVQSECR